jgi:hypothetical protein
VRSNVSPTGRLLIPQPEKLKDSAFNSTEYLELFSQMFDEGVKKVFSNSGTDQYVRFGSPKDNDSNYGIKSGRLTLTGWVHTRSINELAPRSSRITAKKFLGSSNLRFSLPWTLSGITSSNAFLPTRSVYFGNLEYQSRLILSSSHFSLAASPQVHGCQNNSKSGFWILDFDFASLTRTRERSVPGFKAGSNACHRIETKPLQLGQFHTSLTIS